METKEMLVMLFSMLELEIENELMLNSDNIVIKLPNNKKLQLSLQKE